MRAAMALVFVTGIVGMIVSTVAADNNNGAVATFGVFAAIAAVSLIAFTFGHRLAGRVPRIEGRVDPESAGQAMEESVAGLVASGADESQLRALVRQAIAFGRSSSP